MSDYGVVLCRQVGLDVPVRVDQEQFDLDQQKPAKERVWSEWNAAPVKQSPEMLVMKRGDKFIVVDATGTPVNAEGIDADGYKTQAAATKAIEVLTDA